MAQYIKNANIWGRIGSGVGKGLAEQVPKEIERSRLASGLKAISEKKGLTPFQQFAEFASTPGITPQIIQSGSDLLKNQSIRDAYRGENQQGSGSANPTQSQQFTKDMQVGRNNLGNIERSVVQGDSKPSGNDFREEQARSQPGASENPLQDKYIPKVSWTPEMRDADISRIMDKNPYLTLPEAANISSDNERRYLESPKEYQKQLDYITNRENQAEDILDKQLSTALQKEGNAIYGDLTGDTLLDLKKAMNNDLAIDPTLTPKQAAEKWRLKARDFVESKNQVRVNANRPLFDRLVPLKKEENLKNLSVAQKRYAEMGKEKEFYNILRAENKEPIYSRDEKGNNVLVSPGSSGFGASPGGAALIAYPRSPSLKQLIKETNFENVSFQDISGYSRKLAKDFLEKKTSKDSIQAFARSVKDSKKFFDERAFFDYIRDNQDKLTEDQKLELQTGISDLTPNWGDLALFPLTGRSILHE